MSKLHISANLSLPVESVTQTFAILGIRGSGKTNTAVDMMEEMLEHGQQCITIDPTDAWYGIRSSKDGKSEGFKVFIMGGEHGDLPLEGNNGAIMAEFVVESGASVVFSLRHLSIHSQRQFAQDFAERLYDLKGKSENRTPLHIFVDEADEFVPQRIPHGFERMYGAYDRLVRRGRSSGIGLTLISQRAQVIAKDVLSQCETLICHRLLHKLDRKAIEAWTEAHDTQGQTETLMGSLASLGRGEAWFWSPSWLDVFKKVQLRPRETFDSSFTPKAGEKPKTATKLAAVDLDVLKQRLAATIEKAKADDPKELKKRIKELEAQAKKPNPSGVQRDSTPDPKAIARAVREAESPLRKQIQTLRNCAKQLNGYIDKAKMILADAESVELPSELPSVVTLPRPVYKEIGIEPNVKFRTVPAESRSLRASSNGSAIAKGERITLIAIAQYSDGIEDRGQLSVLTGYKRSTRDAYLQRLSEKGFIDLSGRLIRATNAGIHALGSDYEPLPTGDALRDYWLGRLPEGERRVFEVLVENHPKAVSREVVDAQTEYKSSTRDAYLQRLVSRRLVETFGRGEVKASDNLFD